MNRRELLGVLGTVGTAGCLRFQDSENPGGGTGDNNEAGGSRTITGPGTSDDQVTAVEGDGGDPGVTGDAPTEVTLSERWTHGRNLDRVWTANQWFFFNGYAGVAGALGAGMRWTKDVNSGANILGTRAFDTDGESVVFGITPDVEVEEVPDDAGASFHAFKFSTGEARWSVEAPDNGKHAFAQGVAIIDGVAVVGCHHYAEGEPLVYGIAMDSGDVLWETGISDLPKRGISTIFEHDGKAYVAIQGAGIRVMDPNSGSIDRTIENLTTPWTGGTLSGDQLYVQERGTFRVYDLSEEAEQWSSETSDTGVLEPAVDNSIIVVGGDSGGLTAFDRGSGEVRWESSIDREVAAIALAASVVWVADIDTGVTAHRRSDGEIIHRSTHEVDDIAVHGNAILIGGGDTTAYEFDVG